MNTSLDNKNRRLHPAKIIAELDEQITNLDQKHPLERKIKFLLDVRGYLFLNQICGSYVEFGSFMSEMQVAAYKILDGTGTIDRYVGLDIFSGEPALSDEEAAAMPVTQPGDFSCDFAEVQKFVAENLGERGQIIKGDFRQEEILRQCNPFAPFNLAVIDCNLLSSLEAATAYVLPGMSDGGLLFFDDYFTNFGQGNPRIPRMVESLAAVAGKKLLPHGFYPPFAKSFIVCSKET